LSLLHSRSYPFTDTAHWVEMIVAILTRSYGLNLTVIGIGLATIPAWLCLSNSAALAQISIASKTFTQARQIAQPNSVIVLAQRTTPVELPALQPKQAQMAPIDIPVPPQESTGQEVRSTSSSLPRRQKTRNQKNLPVLRSAPAVKSMLLAVPNPNIPIGNRRKQPKVAASQKRATSIGLLYRIVVQAHSASQQTKVRVLVPGAFRTVSNGREIMQAGAFSNYAKANTVLQLLKSKGLGAALKRYGE